MNFMNFSLLTTNYKPISSSTLISTFSPLFGTYYRNIVSFIPKLTQQILVNSPVFDGVYSNQRYKKYIHLFWFILHVFYEFFFAYVF